MSKDNKVSHGVNATSSVRTPVDEKKLQIWLSANVPSFPKAPKEFRVEQFTHGQSNPTFCVIADGNLQIMIQMLTCLF
jgi:aminoglycoside phosphotransferase (APT) family kinase protein